MQPIDKKYTFQGLWSRQGWAFTKIDFVAEFGEVNIHQSRSPNGALAKSGDGYGGSVGSAEVSGL
jgi:hypothetical protein